MKRTNLRKNWPRYSPPLLDDGDHAYFRFAVALGVCWLGVVALLLLGCL